MKKTSLVVLITFIIDRIIKMLVDNFLEYEKEVFIIKKILYLYNCHNKGAAFSILEDSIFFLILISFASLIIIFYYIQKNNFKDGILYGILIGGILGNLVDRLIYGYVIDYIGVIFFNYYFPIFNFADIVIVLSSIILVVRK